MSKTTTATLNKSASAARKVERRASVRLPSNAKGRCQNLSMERETGWVAMVRDISCTGVGLLLPRRFEPGMLLVIELTEAIVGRKHLLVARVARVARQSEGSWLVGCALVDPLAEDDLQLLLGNAP